MHLVSQQTKEDPRLQENPEKCIDTGYYKASMIRKHYTGHWRNPEFNIQAINSSFPLFEYLTDTLGWLALIWHTNAHTNIAQCILQA